MENNRSHMTSVIKLSRDMWYTRSIDSCISWTIVASHGIWARLLLPPYLGCKSVFDLDSMNTLRRHSTDQIAFWQNLSGYAEATLVQWNDTFYKSFGLNDKQRYEIWRHTWNHLHNVKQGPYYFDRTTVRYTAWHHKPVKSESYSNSLWSIIITSTYGKGYI